MPIDEVAARDVPRTQRNRKEDPFYIYAAGQRYRMQTRDPVLAERVKDYARRVGRGMPASTSGRDEVVEFIANYLPTSRERFIELWKDAGNGETTTAFRYIKAIE